MFPNVLLVEVLSYSSCPCNHYLVFVSSSRHSRPSKRPLNSSCRSKSGPRVWSVHSSDLSCHNGPVKLSFDLFSSFLLLYFIPLHQFVHELQVGLNNNIQSSCAHKTAMRVISNCSNHSQEANLLCPRKTQAHRSHYLRYTYRSRSTHTHATMYQGCSIFFLSFP